MRLNRGETIVLEITGDGTTAQPLGGSIFVEGPGAINGHTMSYSGLGSAYDDLEQVAEAMEMTAGEALAVFKGSTGRDLTDMSKWVLADTGMPPKHLFGLLIAGIVFRCEGDGDALVTLETDDPSATFPDYTITIHQTAVRRTYYVDAVGGSDDNTGLTAEGAFATIQKGVDSAFDGDTVMAFPGRYTGEGNRDIDLKGKAVAVRSVDPNDPNTVSATIIDCEGVEGVPHRGFYFHSGEDGSSVVRGLTITNGFAEFGGGIYCCASSPTIADCVLTSNKAEDGGGGIYNEESHPTLLGCLFRENAADWGGGLHNNGTSRPVVRGCEFVGNSVGFGGGAVQNDGSHPVLTNCVFAGNRAGGYGGGISSDGSSETMLVNCTFAENSASEGRACSCGGYSGEGEEPGSLVAAGCILWDGGDEILNNDGWAITITYSDVCGDQAGIGNINADPLFAQPGRWESNGTPVDPCDDFWVEGDYHLSSQAGRWDAVSKNWAYDTHTSPCIDSGNPASALSDETGALLNRRINMGAYGGTIEASRTSIGWSLSADLTNDGIVDARDYALQTKDGPWISGERPGDLDRDGDVDMDDVAKLVGLWLRTTVWH